MKAKLFDYIERDNFIYNLSGLTKLICFFLLSFSVMFSYDIRAIGAVTIFSFVLLRLSGITFGQVKWMLYYVLTFIGINFILTFIFDPTYGTEIYGTFHEIASLGGRYIITQEQMLYQVTKLAKYVAVIPLGMLFLLTTNPSELAASLNKTGMSYKGTYAVSLTLRYFPDMIRNYNDISLAQQSRGLDMSSKEKMKNRIKNIMNICLPLIFSVLDRVEMISNAMDLRGFGKHKKRTWYASKPLKTGDYISLAVSLVITLAIAYLALFVNHGRFYNPFI